MVANSRRGAGTVLPFPPRPRRLEVLISAADARGPVGRTRPLKLTESDLAQLIEAAQRFEAQR
jgi:hypothetical protein